MTTTMRDVRHSSIKIHHDSEKFELPVRLGRINSPGTQDLLIHILAQGKRYQVANHPNVTIPTNLDVGEQTRDQAPPSEGLRATPKNDRITRHFVAHSGAVIRAAPSPKESQDIRRFSRELQAFSCCKIEAATTLKKWVLTRECPWSRFVAG